MHNNDEMMMHYFMQEEENVVVDEDEEPLPIRAALLQFQAAELDNVVPTRGGSSFGRSKAKERQRMGVMPCYGPIILPTMHFLYQKRYFDAALG
jgi:hypothetical protein